MGVMTLFNRKKNHTKKMTRVAAGAAAAGAVSALLLTPKTGKEMRGHVAKGARAVGDKASKMTQKPQQGQENTYPASGRVTDADRSGNDSAGSDTGGQRSDENRQSGEGQSQSHSSSSNNQR